MIKLSGARKRNATSTVDYYLSKYPYFEILYEEIPSIVYDVDNFNVVYLENFKTMMQVIRSTLFKPKSVDGIIKYYELKAAKHSEEDIDSELAEYGGVSEINDTIDVLRAFISMNMDFIYYGYNNSKHFSRVNKTLIENGFNKSIIDTLNRIYIFNINDLLSNTSDTLYNKIYDITDSYMTSSIIVSQIQKHLESVDLKLSECSDTRKTSDVFSSITMDLVCPNCTYVEQVKIKASLDDNGRIFFNNDKTPSTKIICKRCGKSFSNDKFTKFIHRCEI